MNIIPIKKAYNLKQLIFREISNHKIFHINKSLLEIPDQINLSNYTRVVTMELFYANNQDRRLKRCPWDWMPHNLASYSYVVKNLIFQRIIKITFSTW